jgi:hypothetical protein
MKTTLHPVPEYQHKINDIDLASTCLCLGLSMIEIEPQSRTKAFFVFEASHKLDQITQDFYEGKLKVDPMLFAQYRKHLKTRLFGLQSSIKY